MHRIFWKDKQETGQETISRENWSSRSQGGEKLILQYILLLFEFLNHAYYLFNNLKF